MASLPVLGPDGQHIVFESMDDDAHHRWKNDANGGPPRRATDDPGDQRCPTWSRDGQWIYFISDDASGRSVWRVPAAGGAGTLLTRKVTGQAVWESADGSRLFYAIDEALWSIPKAGDPHR
jgi:Tol biopolymer transport system component